MLALVISDDPTDTIHDLAQMGVDATTDLHLAKMCDFVVLDVDYPVQAGRLPVYQDAFTAYTKEVEPLALVVGTLEDDLQDRFKDFTHDEWECRSDETNRVYGEVTIKERT